MAFSRGGRKAEQRSARVAPAKNVDLIAMATHGHRFIGDLIRGTTADKVRHVVDIPVLMLKAKQVK